jgi:tetratricopeptide (TPR) repeat protein/DNA-binding CsgD family transcriptional regulator
MSVKLKSLILFNLKLSLRLIFEVLMFISFVSCKNPRDQHKQATDTLHDSAFMNLQIRLADSLKDTDPDSSFQILTALQQSASLEAFPQMKFETDYLTGIIYYKLHQYDDAKLMFNEALSIARKNKDQLTEARCLERLASLHLSTDDPALALRLYYQSLSIFESLNDKAGMAKVLNILGVYKYEKKVLDTAEMYLNKALQYNTELKDYYGIAENKGNLAYLYQMTNRHHQATEVFKELIAGLEEKGEKELLSILYYNYASLLDASGIRDSAFRLLETSTNLAESNNDTSFLTELYATKADLLAEQGDYKNARIFYNKSLKLAKVLDSPGAAMVSYQGLLNIDTMVRDYKSALYVSSKIKIVSDTLNNREKRNDYRISEYQYNESRRESEIKLKEIAIREMRLRNRVYVLLLIISSLSVFLIIRLFIIRRKEELKEKELLEQKVKLNEVQLEMAKLDEESNRQKIRKAEEKIRVKQHEQISTALAMEQKNELLNQIFDKVKGLASGKGTLSIQDINGILSNIKLQLNESPDSDLFNRHLTEVHEDFYMKLKKQHPDLTSAEVRFCAYLKVHLSGDQIAAILNVTQHAVKKTRYRIRKKLNLETDQSLEDYVLGL